MKATDLRKAHRLLGEHDDLVSFIRHLDNDNIEIKISAERIDEDEEDEEEEDDDGDEESDRPGDLFLDDFGYPTDRFSLTWVMNLGSTMRLPLQDMLTSRLGIVRSELAALGIELDDDKDKTG